MQNITQAQDNKFLMMTTQPVSKLVARLAVPSIVTMMISAIYNMADTFFVARLDIQSPAAVGVVFSYMAFIQAVAFFFGQGSANYISRALGAKDRENAMLIASTGFFTSLIVGVFIGVFGYIYMEEVLRLLGSTDTIMPYAKSYFRYILLGTPMIMCSFVLNNQMRFQGNAWMGTAGIATGAVLNIILDPIFIFYLGLNVAGAAIATTISQSVSFIILLYMTGRGDELPIRLRNFRPTFAQFREIAAGGFPSLSRQGLASVAVAYMNQLAGFYGDLAIAAFSVVNRTLMLSTSIVLGFGQGFQPVCGFNFGAKLYDRVKGAFWFSVMVTTVYGALMSILGYVFAEMIIAVFRPDDAELIALGSRTLRYECFVYTFVGFITITNMFTQNTRKTIRASILAASRQGFMLFIALYFGRKYFGLEGIAMAQPAADFATLLLAIPFAWSALREMR